MAKPARNGEDRRLDVERRLRYAMRKAHDPMFAILGKPRTDPPQPETPLQARVRQR
jgi:hypothetical protein